MRELEIEELVSELFVRMGYSVKRQVRLNFVHVDMVVEGPDGQTLPIDIKLSKRPLDTKVVRDAFLHLRSTAFDAASVFPLLIAIPGITPQAKDFVANQGAFTVWESAEIIHRAQQFPDIGARLVSLIGATQVAPIEKEVSPDGEGQGLIARLDFHRLGLKITPKEYEVLCQQVFAYVFDPYLYDFRRQAETTDGANRYDFICRIKPGNDFWDSVRSDFRTRAILFECKNYSEQITADQVYSTERYLFSTALRTVCFLISPLGPDDGCKRAAQGAMREAGKLIVLLSNDDLIQLVRLSEEKGAAENYLDEKIWDFVVSLPR